MIALERRTPSRGHRDDRSAEVAGRGTQTFCLSLVNSFENRVLRRENLLLHTQIRVVKGANTALIRLTVTQDRQIPFWQQNLPAFPSMSFDPLIKAIDLMLKGANVGWSARVLTDEVPDVRYIHNLLIDITDIAVVRKLDLDPRLNLSRLLPPLHKSLAI